MKLSIAMFAAAMLMASTAFAMPLCSKQGVKRGYACADPTTAAPTASPTPIGDWITNQATDDEDATISLTPGVPITLIAKNSQALDSRPWNLLLDGYLRFTNPGTVQATVTLYVMIGGFYEIAQAYTLTPGENVITPFRMQQLYLTTDTADYSVTAESDQPIVCDHQNFGTTEHSTEQTPPGHALVASPH